jgi:hypothetical protein
MHFKSWFVAAACCRRPGTGNSTRLMCLQEAVVEGINSWVLVAAAYALVKSATVCC